MNQDIWRKFWEAMPPEMKLMLGVFLGSTVHFLRNRASPVAEGLTGSIIAMITGYLLTYAYCWLKGVDYGEYWFIGSLGAFMANFVLGGLETMGKQIEKTPVKALVDMFLDIYETVKARFTKAKE